MDIIIRAFQTTVMPNILTICIYIYIYIYIDIDITIRHITM